MIIADKLTQSASRGSDFPNSIWMQNATSGQAGMASSRVSDSGSIRSQSLTVAELVGFGNLNGLGRTVKTD